MESLIGQRASERGAIGFALAFLAAAALVPQSAFAAGAPVDTAGFEGYLLAPLAGQNNWQGVGGSGTAVVQNVVAQSGAKALRVDRAAGDGSFWAVPLGSNLPSSRFILVEWDMRVAGTGAINGSLGPFFGVEAYDYQGTPARLGNFGVDATTGELLYLKKDPEGALFEVVPNESVDFNLWYRYRMLFDFTLSQYSVYLNDVHKLTTLFADPGVNQFTDADIATMAAADVAGSQSITGTAFFDNFRVFDGIPGDFDNDGDVDATDLPLWKAAYQTTVAGDADGDLDSDGTDFLIWQQNLGIDLTPAVAAGASVPEPGSALLTALAAALLLARRSRPMAG
jgi:hypothetical protein